MLQTGGANVIPIVTLFIIYIGEYCFILSISSNNDWKFTWKERNKMNDDKNTQEDFLNCNHLCSFCWRLVSSFIAFKFSGVIGKKRKKMKSGKRLFLEGVKKLFIKEDWVNHLGFHYGPSDPNTEAGMYLCKQPVEIWILISNRTQRMTGLQF